MTRRIGSRADQDRFRNAAVVKHVVGLSQRARLPDGQVFRIIARQHDLEDLVRYRIAAILYPALYILYTLRGHYIERAAL